jgi:hypothetical protein
MFIGKAERVDVTQLELEFAQTKQKFDALAQQLNDGDGAAKPPPADAEPDPNAPGSRPSGKPPAKTKIVPKGRRNLAGRDDLEERRIEIRDAELEKSGAAFIDWELSYKLRYQRPQAVRVVIARAKYKTPVAPEHKPCADDAAFREQEGERFAIVTASLPPLLIRRGLLAPSMLARIIIEKFRFGMPSSSWLCHPTGARSASLPR